MKRLIIAVAILVTCGCDPAVLLTGEPYVPDNTVEYKFAVGAAVTIRMDGRPAIVMDQITYRGCELAGETQPFYRVKYLRPGSAIVRQQYVSKWLREFELEAREDA